jgi:hypothetical protein
MSKRKQTPDILAAILEEMLQEKKYWQIFPLPKASGLLFLRLHIKSRLSHGVLTKSLSPPGRTLGIPVGDLSGP